MAVGDVVLNDDIVRGVLFDVPIEAKRYPHTKIHRPIDAGIIPPNFVHTWALDIKGFDSFSFEAIGDIRLYWNGDAGDRLTVVNSSNEELQTFRSMGDVQTKAIRYKPSEYDAGDYKRIYIILETADIRTEKDLPVPFNRRFVLKNLRNVSLNTGAEEVLRLEDDINYDTKDRFTEDGGYSVDGKTEYLSPPWAGPDSPGGDFPKPDEKEGWYLLSKNLRHRDPLFYTLLYYNELESKLRVYLFNLNVPSPATAYKIDLWLEARNPLTNKYDELDGLFFPINPNPKTWAKASIILPQWKQYSWTFIEIPFLYPMAMMPPYPAGQNPTPLKSPKWPTAYFSIYEEPFQDGWKNMRLKVRATPYFHGTVEGSIFGTAIGQAIQQMDSVSGLDGTLAAGTATWNAIKTGVDWYDATEKFGKAIEASHKAAADAGTAPGSELLALGATVFSTLGGVTTFGAALAVVGIFKQLLDVIDKPPEPLRMTINLNINAHLNGTLDIPLGGNVGEDWFYLPGRFSMKEALKEGLTPGKIEFVEGKLPSYDRVMGLFGFGADPSKIEINAWWEAPSAMCPEPNPTRPYFGWFAIPATATRTYADVGSPNFSKKGTFVDDYADVTVPLLPVIYNPYAELDVIPTEKGEQGQLFLRVFENADRLNYEIHGKAANYQLVPHLVTPLGPQLPVQYKDFAEHPFTLTQVPIDTYALIKGTSLDEVPLDSEPGTFERPWPQHYPVHDVVYYWHIIYTKPKRSGEAFLGVTTTLNSPLIMKEHQIKNATEVSRTLQSSLLGPA